LLQYETFSLLEVTSGEPFVFQRCVVKVGTGASSELVSDN
jgi:hypothetical protein